MHLPIRLRHSSAVVHGQAVGMMLPHVIRYNASDPVVEAWYAELLAVSGYQSANDGPTVSSPAAGDALARLITRLLEAAGLATRLRDCDISPDSLRGLAENAARQWTAGFNPRPVEELQLHEIYQEAW